MRYSFTLALGLPVALAARTYDSEAWSYMPWPTAAEYKERGMPPPEAASEYATMADIEGGITYLAKLECLGCPFRIREFQSPVDRPIESWQEPPQNNAMLLNFTITHEMVLLNGESILPLASRVYKSQPPAISAYQVPTNTSSEVIEKIYQTHMLDHETWRTATKFGDFELQYEHRLLATRQPDEQLLQFDITAIHMRHQRSYSLDKKGQKMVQILLKRQVDAGKPYQHSISRNGIEIIERANRKQPLKMSCGKDAMIKTSYNPLEYDSYGKLGTWTRSWNQFTSGSATFFARNGCILFFAFVGFGLMNLLGWFIQWSKARAAAAQVKDDAEAALLGVENEDAPPEYSEIATVKEHIEESQ